jgi:Uma2 family endonuclease
MIAVPKYDRHFTPEEYFIWEEQQPYKHELINGLVYAMSGGSQNHSSIQINILALIKNHLRGSNCKVFTSDLKVNILHTANYTYPDLSVTCDERDRKHLYYITYPCLIVEVLSDTTEAYDRGKKFSAYRQNPNLVDYLLVSSNEVAVDIYHRNKEGDWLILSYGSGDQIELKSIGLKVDIEQFYEEITFDLRPNTTEEGFS